MYYHEIFGPAGPNKSEIFGPSGPNISGDQIYQLFLARPDQIFRFWSKNTPDDFSPGYFLVRLNISVIFGPSRRLHVLDLVFPQVGFKYLVLRFNISVSFNLKS